MSKAEGLYEAARLTELHNKTKHMVVTSADVMSLVELVRLQNTTINILRSQADPKYGLPYADRALAAFYSWDKQE